MSELTNTSSRDKQFLWQLLSTVSTLVLIGTASAAMQANAAEDDAHPTVWVELGGSLQRVDTSEEKYAPPFLFSEKRPDPETVDPLSVGHLPRSAFGGEGKITFQPEGSSWNFSAAVRYGRSNAHQHLHQQSSATAPLFFFSPAHPAYQHVFQFIDAKKTSQESHTVLDFQAGKDVGLGILGSSVLNAGVRFAQFDSRSSTSFGSDPDAHISWRYFAFGSFRLYAVTNALYHVNDASASASRSFHGVGPSLSWNASTPVVGNERDGQIILDWGVNAALLFGRQKAKIHHQSTTMGHTGKYPGYGSGVFEGPTYPDPGHDFSRSKTVTVPNIGAFAGLTYQVHNFKLSAGYRADFFFGAMDGGVDTRKSEDQKFYGPFATISIGLGG